MTIERGDREKLKRYEQICYELQRWYDGRLTPVSAQKIHELEQESLELEYELFGGLDTVDAGEDTSGGPIDGKDC